MPRSPASVPDLCISSGSSLPKEGVSYLLSSSRASCRALRVASEIRPLVLIQTSVVIEGVANSSLPSRHHPLCRLHLPSALRFFKRGLGFVFSSKWAGEKDPVIRCGESGDQF